MKPFVQRANNRESNWETEGEGEKDDFVADCVDFAVFLLCILRGGLPRNETEADQQESRMTSHYV